MRATLEALKFAHIRILSIWMTHLIRLEPSGRELLAGEDESILDSALREGVALPYGCRNGACRSCRGRLLEGDVDYPNGPPKGLNPADLENGFVLCCEARPRGDIRLEVDEIDSEAGIVVRTLPVRVEAKEPLAHDVTRIRLRLQAGERLRFLAGQYVDVVLRDGRRRAFSLANPPRDDGRLELQIRNLPGGDFSSYVFDHLKVRAILRLHGPLGSFYLRKRGGRAVILMAGGTGFAPINSIVEDAISTGFPHPMHLYWGVRSRHDLYLHDLATEWSERHETIHYTPVLSEPVPADAWPGRTGFVHQAVAEDFPNLSAYDAYMSGPPPMVSAGRETFVARGLDPARIHADSFDYAYETGHDEAR